MREVYNPSWHLPASKHVSEAYMDTADGWTTLVLGGIGLPEGSRRAENEVGKLGRCDEKCITWYVIPFTVTSEA